MKKPAVKASKSWRVILPSGAVIDYTNVVPTYEGNTLTLWRGKETIAVFQTWAAFTLIESTK